jgi:hypothetical protein
MTYDPRSIAFLSDLFHPPLAPDPAAIQKVHNAMFQSGRPDYACFAVTPAGAVLSNPVARPDASSSASFLADRMQFREELGALTCEAFAERVKRVAGEVCALRNLQLFTAQQVTIRSLVNPRSWSDSRAYLKQAMFGFDDETEAFDQEPQLYGIRLAFPPSEQHPAACSLRIESFNGDPRSLYIEIQASYGPVIVARDLAALESNVLDAYGFLLEQALPFIHCFDAPQPTD